MIEMTMTECMRRHAQPTLGCPRCFEALCDVSLLSDQHPAALVAAREEGFAAAREQAAGIVRDMLEWQGSTPVGDRIRAMRDGAGEEPSPTARCRCGTVAREHEDSAPWACTASGCEGFRWQARP